MREAINVFKYIDAVVKNLACRVVIIVVIGIREVAVAVDVLDRQVLPRIPSNRHGGTALVKTFVVVTAREELMFHVIQAVGAVQIIQRGIGRVSSLRREVNSWSISRTVCCRPGIWVGEQLSTGSGRIN